MSGKPFNHNVLLSSAHGVLLTEEQILRPNMNIVTKTSFACEGMMAIFPQLYMYCLSCAFSLFRDMALT